MQRGGPQAASSTRVFLVRGSGQRAVHSGCPSARPVPRTRPGLPEHQRDQDARQSDAHQDPTDGVDVHRPRCGVDREREDRADGDQEDSNSESDSGSLVISVTKFPARPERKPLQHRGRVK